MDFGSAVLNVLAVIGIIIVAGLVIYLLAALVVSIIDKKEVRPFKSHEENKEFEEQRYLLENKDYQLSFDEEEKEEPKVEEVEEEKEEEEDQEPKEVEQTIDLDLADEERRQIQEREKVINNDIEEPEEEEDDDDLEAMYAKLINDINSEATVEDEEDNFVAEPEQEEEVTEEEEVAEEPVVEEQEEVVEEVEEEPVVVAEPVKEEPKVNEEMEALRAQLAALQAEKEALAKQLEEKPAVETVETESLEALLARKAVLEERLTASEKELKANKKEYVPLAKIKKHLESDKAKLRRKEAVVAKQKVVLFGVNNYVVDPEKEKKLSEDLDVLDALRLSVQHCEEVMKENEDRYPILEKTNGILVKQVEELRADIAELNARIEKLQGEGNADAE